MIAVAARCDTHGARYPSPSPAESRASARTAAWPTPRRTTRTAMPMTTRPVVVGSASRRRAPRSVEGLGARLATIRPACHPSHGAVPASPTRTKPRPPRTITPGNGLAIAVTWSRQAAAIPRTRNPSPATAGQWAPRLRRRARRTMPRGVTTRRRMPSEETANANTGTPTNTAAHTRGGTDRSEGNHRDRTAGSPAAPRRARRKTVPPTTQPSTATSAVSIAARARTWAPVAPARRMAARRVSRVAADSLVAVSTNSAMGNRMASAATESITSGAALTCPLTTSRGLAAITTASVGFPRSHAGAPTFLISGNFFNLFEHYYALEPFVDVVVTEMRNTLWRQPEWYRHAAGFARGKPLVVVENPYGGVVPEMVRALADGRARDRFLSRPAVTVHVPRADSGVRGELRPRRCGRGHAGPPRRASGRSNLPGRRGWLHALPRDRLLGSAVAPAAMKQVPRLAICHQLDDRVQTLIHASVWRPPGEGVGARTPPGRINGSA